MKTAIVTGAGGLIGSEASRSLVAKGYRVIGIDNDLRAYFFGVEASTGWMIKKLKEELANGFEHQAIDIRDDKAIMTLFEAVKPSVVIHAAAQPSHDWAVKDPQMDFAVNANGTLNLLEASRHYAFEAPFIFCSTNKVYGDRCNEIPLVEHETRFEPQRDHPYAAHGIDETMSIDETRHSLFGASKVAADILVQEYGRYFGMPTVSFRGGCLTGPAHSGAELHGFLAYMVRCAFQGRQYRIFGYQGKQVRDNIHSEDLMQAFWHYIQNPKPGKVYNIGGGRRSNCSLQEARELIEKLSSRALQTTYEPQNRIGDHIWWISDVRKFCLDYPGFRPRFSLEDILQSMILETQKRGMHPK